MVNLTCPWCEEEILVDSPSLEGPAPAFTCPGCRTTIAFVEEPRRGLEPAA